MCVCGGREQKTFITSREREEEERGRGGEGALLFFLRMKLHGLLPSNKIGLLYGRVFSSFYILQRGKKRHAFAGKIRGKTQICIFWVRRTFSPLISLSTPPSKTLNFERPLPSHLFSS